jgi:hypothetical protein
MNAEEEKQFELLSRQAEAETLRRMDAENKISQMSGFSAGKEPNIIEYQLDVSPTLDRIYHLLSGHILKTVNGNEKWEEPEDDRLKILSDYGVKQIMNLLSLYISPDTLLANLTEEQVYWITKDFGIELADLMFNRYEVFYSYPSPEELFDIYKPVVKKQGLNIDEKELYNKCVQWSREELQMKFRHFPIQVQSITNKVFINLTRAIKGEERRTLRTQYNIHQNLSSPGQDYPQQIKPNIFKPSTWR